MKGVTNFLGYGGDSGLRPAPTNGSVRLPEDLFSKSDVQTEWWYYTGHCVTVSGRQIGFELVFFKRRTDLDFIGGVPVALVGNPMYFAHFAISDVMAETFKYDHIRSFGLPIDPMVSMSQSACDIQFGDWSLREVAGKHILHATLPEGVVFDAVLDSAKPIVLNGDGGITRKKSGASNHFSYTRMNAVGQISTNGEIENFTGSAWMDREFGIWEQGNWDWFSIQFDDETELMIYQFADESIGMPGDSTGTFIASDGSCEYLRRSDFEIEVLDYWTSKKTGARYPSCWRVIVERLGIDIETRPLIPDQELDTRGSTMIVYWEGACGVSGTKNGNSAAGRAYVELVGYDRSHETAGMSDFLFGGLTRRLRDMLDQ